MASWLVQQLHSKNGLTRDSYGAAGRGHRYLASRRSRKISGESSGGPHLKAPLGHEFGKAEVEDVRLGMLRHKDVGRLDVAVDDPLEVRCPPERRQSGWLSRVASRVLAGCLRSAALASYLPATAWRSRGGPHVRRCRRPCICWGDRGPKRPGLALKAFERLRMLT
jgi:hypothetical protein